MQIQDNATCVHINLTRKEALSIARQLLQSVEVHIRLNDEMETGGVILQAPPFMLPLGDEDIPKVAYFNVLT